MSDQVFNISLGRIVEFYNRVDLNDPANSAFVLMAIVTSDSDAALKDVDTFTALLALASTAEATNASYARVILDDADLVSFAPDDANDRVDLDIPDQTFTGVASGDNWTDIVFGYDSDTTSGTDANIVPMTLHDFVVTPNGGDITIQVAATGFFRAS